MNNPLSLYSSTVSSKKRKKKEKEIAAFPTDDNPRSSSGLDLGQKESALISRDTRHVILYYAGNCGLFVEIRWKERGIGVSFRFDREEVEILRGFRVAICRHLSLHLTLDKPLLRSCSTMIVFRAWSYISSGRDQYVEFEARSLHRRINRSSFLIDTDRNGW